MPAHQCFANGCAATRSSSVGVNLPQYLANMDKLANAVAGAQKFHLAPGEKSLVALVRPPQ